MLGSLPFDEAVGVQRESSAAGISPELKAPWEEQTLARLRQVLSSDVCTAIAAQGCCETQLIKTSKGENSGSDPFTDILPHIRCWLRCLLSKENNNKHRGLSNFRWSNKKKKNTMTQACLCLCCWVTKTSRKRDNQGQWCQVGGTWFDGLLNNTEGYLFIKCCTSEVPGMGGTWGVFSCFNSTWVAFEPKLYLREGQWKDNAYDAYACSEWRCQSPKSPTETSTPHIHTLRLTNTKAAPNNDTGERKLK